MVTIFDLRPKLDEWETLSMLSRFILLKVEAFENLARLILMPLLKLNLNLRDFCLNGKLTVLSRLKPFLVETRLAICITMANYAGKIYLLRDNCWYTAVLLKNIVI